MWGPHQPDFTAANGGIAVPKLETAVAEAFHLPTLQRDTCFKCVLDRVVVSRLAISGDDVGRHALLPGHGTKNGRLRPRILHLRQQRCWCPPSAGGGRCCLDSESGRRESRLRKRQTGSIESVVPSCPATCAAFPDSDAVSRGKTAHRVQGSKSSAIEVILGARQYCATLFRPRLTTTGRPSARHGRVLRIIGSSGSRFGADGDKSWG